MKYGLMIWLMLGMLPVVQAQEEEAGHAAGEQQWEVQAEAGSDALQDDSWLQQLVHYRRHPLNINQAGAAELSSLPGLSGWQIQSLIRYREILGKLVHVNELQAVPGWELSTIRQVLPFITVQDRPVLAEKLQQRLHGGEQAFLLRCAPAGYDSVSDQRYTGSQLYLLARYRYNYKNLLQYGITGEKDAGEAFFRGPAKTGFDFYSAHLFLRKLGIVESLALGDFTVNLGQGLIQWQSLAFRKGSAVMSVKREGPVLKPYNSSGEFNFHRGAGITLRKAGWQFTCFGSWRKLSAHLMEDTIEQGLYISSLLPSGYHRTVTELNSRNNIDLLTAGANLQYRQAHWHIGLNTLNYHCSHPFRSSGKPYDLYSVAGDRWSNYSIDYSGSFRNLHWFGELAIDRQRAPAFLHGFLLSLDARAALSLLYRQIDQRYQSFFSNAFTENSQPVNEQGLYTGISLRPAPGWQLDAYADLYRFPWLKYRLDAPGGGSDYLFLVIHTPRKNVEWYVRYRMEQKTEGPAGNLLPTMPVLPGVRQQWRAQCTFRPSPRLTLRQRFEWLWHKGPLMRKEQGVTAFMDLSWRPVRSFSLDCRWQYFETDGYNARVYAYEQDVSYSFSIPALYGKGVRYYLLLKYQLPERWAGSFPKKFRVTCWLRYGGFLRQEASGENKYDIRTRKPGQLQLQCMIRSK